MSIKNTLRLILIYGLIASMLSGCFRPPFNNFKTEHGTAGKAAGGAAVGAGLGAIAGSMSGNLLSGIALGGAAGGAVGLLIGLQKESKPHIIKELKKYDIQYVQYGDTMTLLVPTDQYFIFNSPRLNETKYPPLLNIIKLLSYYPDSPVYVAGFTDNVGSRHHKNLMSQAQAETMLTFLWANGVAAKKLKAEGYGEKNDIGDNDLIHGSAFNRRIEIQWFTGTDSLRCCEKAEA